MSRYQETADLIAALLVEAGTPDIIRSDISYATRFLMESAKTLDNEVQLLRNHIRTLHEIDGSTPPEDIDKLLMHFSEHAGLQANPIKPLQEDQMAAIINTLNQPERIAEELQNVTRDDMAAFIQKTNG